MQHLILDAMPKYLPNSRFSDCFASVGNITFFHRDGECYYRTKANPVFPCTAGQLVQLSIHQRGLKEWRKLTHNEQLEWNALAKSVRSKRPPFNTQSHISGYNLFMSAYHGLACIGNERIPEPRPLPDFPVVCLELSSAFVLNDIDLQICFRICRDTVPERFRIIGKIQLTVSGYSNHRGKFRNYVGTITEDGHVSFIIHKYRNVCGLDLKEYHVHLRCFVIDAESGLRSKEKSLSAGIRI